jgi:hypothetical protein
MGRIVTVKKPSSLGWLTTEWQDDESAFENQVDILRRVFSRRLVNLLGYKQDGTVRFQLVVDFMENESLHSLLHPAKKLSAG